jgi:hypothetical protein
MRFNASPTISIAGAKPAAALRVSSDQERAAESFGAILAAIVMKPVAEAMGPMGAFFGDAVARAGLERAVDDDPA